jgi:hypothetical protein
MILKLDSIDIENLHNKRCDSKVMYDANMHEGFEWVKSPDIEYDYVDGDLYWVGDNYVNALILYQWFLNVECQDASIMWDTHDLSYVVWKGTEWSFENKGSE